MELVVGEQVEFKPQGAPAAIYVIVRRVPDGEHGEPMYRIKSAREICERNVPASALTPLLKRTPEPERMEPPRRPAMNVRFF